MSYYGHPYVITPQGYFSAGQQAQQAQQQTPSAQQLALEERQALAYLQSVRRRREAAEAAMALEAKERQRATAEREKALRAAAERHNALIQAARRERAIREALDRERQREVAFQQALQAHQAQQVQASIEAERRRQTMAAEAYARALAEHRQRSSERSAQAPTQTSQAPTQPKAPDTQQTQAQDEDDEVDLDGINALLGQLFGFNLATEPTEEPPAPKPKKEQPKKEEPKSTEQPKAAPAQQQAADKATPAPKEEEDTGLPDDLNQLLHQFLGLDVGPATEGEHANPKASQQLVGDAVGDLNAFLAQYGLEFFPESESDSEDESTQARKTEAPKAVESKDDSPKFKITNEAGWANLPAENDKNAKTEAPKAVEAKDDSPKFKITNEAGWANLPAENDKNAKSTAAPSAATAAALAAPSSSAASAAPKEQERPRQASREPDEEAPFTSTLGSYQDLPPYLRDILSQIEAAMCEEDHGDECECDPETRTACAHGTDGGPCAAHRQRHRRERAMAKKRASKERRQARRSKKYASGQEEKDEAGVPFVASAKDIILHHDVSDQAAASGAVVEHEDPKDSLSAQEARQEAIPKGEPGWAVDEHRAAATEAAAAGTSSLHAPKPTTESQEKIDAREEKQEAIPAEASKADVAAHRKVADQAAAEVKKSPVNVAAVIGAQEAREEAIPKGESREAVDEHRKAAEAAAATPHSELHADAPTFHPKSEGKQKPKPKQKQEQKDLKPASPEAEEAVQKLNAISQQLHATCSKFTFPRNLTFSPSLADATQPPLTYTRNNHAYHAQAHSLMQLLLAVDGVQSHGDKAVRNRRKEVVKEIEGALNDLEKGRDAKWQEVKARRERGDSDDDDDDWVLTGDTTDATSDLEA